MRYAIISDIHGNARGLKAVLRDINYQQIEELIFVGDYFGDLPYPNEVVDIISGLDNKHVISGNKEGYLQSLLKSNKDDWIYNQFNALYWNYNNLTNRNLNYLCSLPGRKVIELGSTKILMVHSITELFKETNLNQLTSSRFAEKMESKQFTHEEYIHYIFSVLSKDQQLLEQMKLVEADIIIFGHTHIQWNINLKGKTLINAGSCGVPLDFNSYAPYTILNIDSEGHVVVEERRVKYDVESLIEEVMESELFIHAEGWSRIIIDQLKHARDEISFFFRHANEVASMNNEHSWPISNDLWEKAIREWFEGKASKVSDSSFI